ncbi:condensation domain-containing protein [Candidatus Profftella armatura]
MTGKNEIIIGMVEMGRSQEIFENSVGYFINMLPIRINNLMDSKESLNKFIDRLQFIIADAIDNSAYPFSAMVRDLCIKPNINFSPIFQIAFEYQNAFSKMIYWNLINVLKKIFQ